jgi:penicillin-binding protein A
VVALDPRTGEILALWSWPAYDPNLVSDPDIETASQARGLYLVHPDQPLLGRAYQERYFPGSSFKVVVSAAGLESGLVTPDSPVYPPLTNWTPPLTTRPITNAGGGTCGGTLADILRVSCNTAYAEMGALTLGPRVLTEGAEAFGFNDRPPVDLPNPAMSVFPTDYGEPLSTPDRERPDADVPGTVFENTPSLAQAAIGQHDVSASPLQMALVAAGVANGGTIMTPRTVHEIRDADGGLIERFEPTTWRRAMSPSNAAVLRQAMVGVVTNGTGTAMAIPGYEVGGKTGTARIGDGASSHAWMIGFAGPPGETPHVAIAVVVLARDGAGAQSGGRVAAPVARAVLEAALTPPPPPEAQMDEAPPELPADPPPDLPVD